MPSPRGDARGASSCTTPSENAKKEKHSRGQTPDVTPQNEADSDVLAALAFTPGTLRDRVSSDEWSDPLDLDDVVSPLRTALSDLWVSPLPKDRDESRMNESNGVSLPPLLKELLGVDFLPQKRQSSSDTDIATMDCSTAENDAAEEEDEEEVDEPTLDSFQSQLSLDVALEHPSIAKQEASEPTQNSKKETKGRRRLSASLGKMLSTKVRKAGERRKQRRRGKQEIRDSLASQESSRDESLSYADEQSDEGAGNRVRAATEPANIDEAWIQAQQAQLEEHKLRLDTTHTEIQTVQLRAKAISAHISKVQRQAAELEASLAESMRSMEQDTALLAKAKKDLERLEAQREATSQAIKATTAAIRRESQPFGSSGLEPPASLDDDPVLNPMMATPRTSNAMEGVAMHSAPRSDPQIPRSASASFIRVHDLDLDSVSDLSSQASGCCMNSPSRELVFLDNDVKTVLDALIKFGFQLATDESRRFTPVLNTEQLLSKCPPMDHDSWPIRPWFPAYDKEVLVWSGMLDHDGHGCHLPVVKARGIIKTAPRNVIELVLDSTRVHEYNKMSQGRKDVVYLQKGLDTKAEDSPYSIAGEAKITQSVSKAPMIRRGIEMLSLLYARPLEEGGLVSVSRSVWEDQSGQMADSKDMVRSEILLSVNLVRPVKGPNEEQSCEMTTITHVHTSVVPEYLYKKVGPTQAAKFIRELQSLFGG